MDNNTESFILFIITTNSISSPESPLLSVRPPDHMIEDGSGGLHGHPPIAKLHFISRSASVIVFLIGVLGLAGWSLGIDRLRTVVPGLPAVVPNASLGLMLAGLSLWFAKSEGPPKAGQLLRQSCAWGMILIGALALAEYIIVGNIHNESTTLRDILRRMSISGTPSFLGACNFLLFGLALLLLNGRSHWAGRTVEILIVTATLVAALALVGYACRVPAFYQWESASSGMPLHSAIAFIALGAGMLCANPSGGLIQTIISQTDAGVMARRLLLAPVVIPLLTGLLALVRQRMGIFNLESESWLFAYLNVFLFTIALWISVESLRRSETARNRYQKDFQRFFTLPLDIMCIAGADGYFKRVNPAFGSTLGYTNEEMLGRPFLEFIHPDDHAATLLEVQKLSKGQPTLNFENRYRCKDGSWRVLLWRVQPVPGEGLLYATAHDITHRKETERAIQQLNDEVSHRADQLEAANKELESFSYSISHDLRAPLRHVIGYAEMLGSDSTSHLSKEAGRCLQTITDASMEMGQLIDDLLSFSRLGRSPLGKTPLALDNVVMDVLQGLEMSTRGRDIVWKIPSLPTVTGDPSLIKQIWANLLGNAVKYSRGRDPAEIEIAWTGPEDGWIEFSVRDNGAGFDMQYADNLFGVFQRLHRADEFEGTGIGLAIVRRIVSRHGGRTWAEGKLGVGATFYFTLKSPPAEEASNTTPS